MKIKTETVEPIYTLVLCMSAADGSIVALEIVCRNLKAIIIHALKWDIEQGPLESSWYSLLFHGCEGIFARLGSNEEIPEFLNLSDF